LLIFGFVKDFIRKECQDDVRYRRMSQVSQVIMFFTSFSDLVFLVLIISILVKIYRGSKRRRQDPPVLSSDEEDDAEFLRFVENRDAQNA